MTPIPNLREAVEAVKAATPGAMTVRHETNIFAGDGGSATSLQANFFDSGARNRANAEALVAAFNVLQAHGDTLLALLDAEGDGNGFQAGVEQWIDACFVPSLYSDMTERGDRLLEEVLELLQSKGYDRNRVATLVDYVYGRPAGDPAQEVGGVMVTLAGYCWIAGLNMHTEGERELARIRQPEVMAKIRAKQAAKAEIGFDTPLPGPSIEHGAIVRYDSGETALARLLKPHAGGWHALQCRGGLTFVHGNLRAATGGDLATWKQTARHRPSEAEHFPPTPTEAES